MLKNNIFNFTMIFILWGIVPLTFILLGQDANWDLQNYHLYIPITLFEGSFANDVAPAGIQSYFNPLQSLPAYLIHRVANTPNLSFIGGLILSSFQGLCGPIVFMITKKLLKTSNIIAFLCSLLGITGAIYLSEAGTSFGDLTLSVLQLFSVFLCCTSLEKEDQDKFKRLAFSWGLIGASCGIKFTSIFITPLVFCLTIASFQEINNINIFKKIRSILFIIIIPFVLSFFVLGFPGFILAWSDNKNPFFPLFSSIFGRSPLFLIDNDIDIRFIATSFLDIFTAPIKDFVGDKSYRAELLYRDPRTMITFYSGIISSFIYFISRYTYHRSNRISYLKLPAFIWFQIGLFFTYIIWIRIAGIARYAISFQAILGISLLISLSIIINQIFNPREKQTLMLENLSKNQNLYLIIFLFILSFCLTNTTVPNWGRVDFQVKWNSLQIIENIDKKDEYKNPFDNDLVHEKSSVLLLNKPLGWLKQYAPKQSFNLFWPVELSPLGIKLIKENIVNTNNEFIVIDSFWNDKSTTLQNNKFISLYNKLFNFKTQNCTDFKSPIGSSYIIRACNAKLQE